jgi:hypothetical protein
MLPIALVVEFDPKHNVLRGTLTGRMTGTTLLKFYSMAEKYMASHPPCRGILDFSGVTDFEVSAASIRQVAQAPPAFPAGYARVLVIPKDFIYGLARMYQILTEDTRPELQIVRIMEEAYQLLDMKSPEFHPVNDIPFT